MEDEQHAPISVKKKHYKNQNPTLLNHNDQKKIPFYAKIDKDAFLPLLAHSAMYQNMNIT